MLNHDTNIFSIARRIGRPLILDGATGSLLQEKYKSKDSLWMSYLNIEKPAVIKTVHKAYVKAGADIITTNTFRTNPAAIKNANISPEKIVKQSVEIAAEAVKATPVLVAGSNPPAEDCYKKSRDIPYKILKENHHNHIKFLYDNLCHFILNETQSHLDEIEIICNYCSRNKIPFVVSFYFDNDLRILSGEKLKKAVNYVLNYNPLAIGFNCIKPETFLKFFEKENFNYNWGVYLNCGAGNITEEKISCGVTPADYGLIIKSILNKSPSFVGACCGSSPEHTSELKRILNGRNYS